MSYIHTINDSVAAASMCYRTYGDYANVIECDEHKIKFTFSKCMRAWGWWDALATEQWID